MRTTGIIMPGLIGYTEDGNMIRDIRTPHGGQVGPKPGTDIHQSNDSDDGEEWSDGETVPILAKEPPLKRKANNGSTAERPSKRPADQTGKQNAQNS